MTAFAAIRISSFQALVALGLRAQLWLPNCYVDVIEVNALPCLETLVSECRQDRDLLRLRLCLGQDRYPATG
jgi:hypothetical protein